jgi:type I restriction-modification system DNA methylase subunit
MKYSNAEHLSKEKQKKLNAFFTPRNISIEMVLKLFPEEPDHKDLTILDPCVGRGNLFKAVKEIYSNIPNECFYGVDIDRDAIELNKNDPELFGMHFRVGNCLTDDIFADEFWA